MKSLLRNGKVIRLGALPDNRCVTLDLNRPEAVKKIDNIPDRTLLYVLVALSIFNLIKK